MTKAVALFGLTAVSFAATLGNFWFTFGLWPKSWSSFALFFAISVTTTMLYRAVMEDK